MPAMNKRAAIISFTLGAAVLLVFAQVRYPPVENGSLSIASAAATRKLADFPGKEAWSKEALSPGPLPLGEVQYVTVKAFVVEGLEEFTSAASQDGTSFTVASELKPGQRYEIHLVLNSASDVTQAAELVVNKPDDLSIELDMPAQQAIALDIEQQAPNRWTVITAPAGEDNGGFFDLIITAYATRYMSLEKSRATFTLKTPYHLPSNPGPGPAGFLY
jgi:hypothetical protein